MTDALTDTKRKRGGQVGSRQLRDLYANEDRIGLFLSYLSAGASPGSAGGALGIAPSSIQNWMERGREKKGRLYVRFIGDVTRCISEATVLAETKVSKRDEKYWLRHGPAKRIGIEWKEDADTEKQELSTVVNDQAHLTADSNDVMLALQELRSAGIDLNALVDAQGSASAVPDDSAATDTNTVDGRVLAIEDKSTAHDAPKIESSSGLLDSMRSILSQ